MENIRFNPADHLMDLKGKAYLQVAWRLVWFREDHAGWTIRTEAVTVTDKSALFKAEIADETGRVLSTGWGSETPNDFKDFIEKAETKAVGRALAMLGYGTQFAPELDEGERIVDSPLNLGRGNATRPTTDATSATANPGDMIVPFGRFRGKPLAAAIATDPGYVDWMARAEAATPELRAAIAALKGGAA